MPSAGTSGDVAVISGELARSGVYIARPVFRISGGSLSPRASSGRVAPCDRPVERGTHLGDAGWLKDRPPTRATAHRHTRAAAPHHLTSVPPDLTSKSCGLLNLTRYTTLLDPNSEAEAATAWRHNGGEGVAAACAHEGR
eukprot:scaffold39755_cov28-Phaeocystis_antarctica.AAC.1